jgi:excisionase family DNA binding protein
VQGTTQSTGAGTILTVQGVADRLQVSKATVYELTRFRQSAGIPRLPARKVGKQLRFITAEVDMWFAGLPRHKHLQKRSYNREAT